MTIKVSSRVITLFMPGFMCLVGKFIVCGEYRVRFRANFQLHEEFKVARLPESKRFRIKQIILLFKLPISCFLHDSIVLKSLPTDITRFVKRVKIEEEIIAIHRVMHQHLL